MWGTAAPGATITVAVTATSKDPVLHTTAGSSGTWQLDLAPRPANSQPSSIRLACTVAGAVSTVEADGVLFGDVYG